MTSTRRAKASSSSLLIWGSLLLVASLWLQACGAVNAEAVESEIVVMAEPSSPPKIASPDFILLDTGPTPRVIKFSDVLWERQAIALAFQIPETRRPIFALKNIYFTLLTADVNPYYRGLDMSICHDDPTSPRNRPTPDPTRCIQSLRTKVPIYQSPVYFTWRFFGRQSLLPPGKVFWLILESEAVRIGEGVKWVDTENGTDYFGTAFRNDKGWWIGEGNAARGVATLKVTAEMLD